jgi:hypothetical protein
VSGGHIFITHWLEESGKPDREVNNPDRENLSDSLLLQFVHNGGIISARHPCCFMALELQSKTSDLNVNFDAKF